MAAMQTKQCRVYALSSSEDGAIRYIGQTVTSPGRRLRQHIACALKGGKWPLCKWIRKVIAKGATVQVTVLVENAVLNETEAKLIASYRAMGVALMNVTDGGEGFVGHVHSAETRRKMSEAAKRRAATPAGKEHLRRAGYAALGIEAPVKKSLSEVAKERLKNHPESYKAILGPKSEATRTKIAGSVKSRWDDPEYRQKVLDGHATYWTPERRAAQAERARNQKH